MELNQQQQRAVEHEMGPCLVLACPGSGKTRTLTSRTARLIEKGHAERRILSITFTNLAANEMKGRICKLLGRSESTAFIGTFHAFCVRVLRKFGGRLGYARGFTIVDSDDQKDLIGQLGRRLLAEIDEPQKNEALQKEAKDRESQQPTLFDAKGPPKKSKQHTDSKLERGEIYSIADHVNNHRESVLEDEDDLYERLNRDPIMFKIAQRYIDHLREENMVDFSGLLSETVRLFDEHPDVLGRIQRRFDFLSVDEVQDTNYAQFVIAEKIAAGHNNMFLVGDHDQCVVEGTDILMPGGDHVSVEDIREGDEVATAFGGTGIRASKVERIHKKEVKNKQVVSFWTRSGAFVKTTSEHIHFAGYLEDGEEDLYFTYLMYHDRLGFRVGTTRKYAGYEREWCGFCQRTRQEGARKIWILRTSQSEAEARYWEQYYSVRYGIPTWIFKARSGSARSYDQSMIDSLFSSINTSENAMDLMGDLSMYVDYPHYMQSPRDENNFTITLCADSRHHGDRLSPPLHRYCISSQKGDADAIRKLGFNARAAKYGKGWRIDSAIKDLSEAYGLYGSLRSSLDNKVNLRELMRLAGFSLPFTPASHLREGMAVFVRLGDTVILDHIESISSESYSGFVYDLDINRTHNYIAGGIVTHNSIYGWRGARIQNVFDFLEKYPDCKKIVLHQNYRSTPEIVVPASQLIAHNQNRLNSESQFEATNASGEKVQVISHRNQLDEAQEVAVIVEQLVREFQYSPSEIVVLYRMNSMSEPIEQALMRAGIQYQVIGGRSFYSRKEVKDCLAMLRLVSNPSDGIAFHRVISLTQGVGDKTIGKIENIAHAKRMGVIAACDEYVSHARSSKITDAISGLADKFRKYNATMPVAKVAKSLIDDLEYEGHVERSNPDDYEDRLQNVQQLVDSSAAYGDDQDSISRYLQMVSLMTSVDQDSKDDRVSIMTLHACKGKEYPVVIMIGVENAILPHAMAVKDDPIGGLEEERRLCYVGMTRAQKLLFMSYCHGRKRFGKNGSTFVQKTEPSPFLMEAGVLSLKDAHMMQPF